MLSVTAACGTGPTDAPIQLIAASFNTGTADISGQLAPEANGGWGSAQAAISGMYYGHGLAFPPVIAQVRAFFDGAGPDVVALQELFYSGDCPSIPAEARTGFVCERWKEGDPTVVEALLGPGYQIACHLGKNDKCLGVKKSFGRFRGCTADLCLGGLDGAPLPGCGNGSRIGRGVIELSAGGTLTVVSVHGTSGLSAEDAACRVRQFAQVFEDFGDGAPAASGARNLILGDFNTDPVRFHGGDASADALLGYTGGSRPFRFVSPVGEGAEPSYGGLVNIDHLISDFAKGSCWSAGITGAHPAPTPLIHFDHRPLVCSVSAP
jgi:hypothetical protein